VLGAARRGGAVEQTVDEWWIVEPEIEAGPEGGESTSQE
jgi:hypothetical protein